MSVCALSPLLVSIRLRVRLRCIADTLSCFYDTNCLISLSRSMLNVANKLHTLLI